MDDYIGKSVAIARLTALEVDDPCATMTDAKRMIADISPADVVPVVRGHWVVKRKIRGGFRVREGVDEHGVRHRITVDERYEVADPYCPVCGKVNESVWLNYCPNCGAKLEGGDGDEAN